MKEQDRIILSASDITQASACQWAVMRKLDFLLGRLSKEEVPETTDPMLERSAEAGNLHEERLIRKFRTECGEDAVVELPRASTDGGLGWLEAIEKTREATLDALRSPAQVIAQAAFFDGEMVGYADFIVKAGTDSDGHQIFEVWDAKLALHVKVTALLQLAAYTEQMNAAGIAHSSTVKLVLGDQSFSEHDVSRIAPTYRRQKSILRELCDERLRDDKPTFWGDPRYVACGRCSLCSPEIDRTNDVLLTFGVQKRQANLLHAQGITTLGELAELHPVTRSVEGIPLATLGNLAAQAAVQQQTRSNKADVPVWEWRDPGALAALPEPSPGDVFFDFEGDPLDSESPEWGIDYLFGVWADDGFTAYWADNLVEERQRFDEFINWLVARLEKYPDLHVYHYAPYERTHLLSLARRHDLHIQTVDAFLRNEVFFDLYPMVRRGLWVGQPSYSIKKLEPLYMESRDREGITAGDDSVLQYVRYRFLLADIEHENDPDEQAALRAQAEEIKTLLLNYNRDDCYSTELLRDWLRQQAVDAGVTFTPAVREEKKRPLVLPLYYGLRALVQGVDPDDRHPLETALALAASALEYYRLEGQSFWWEHVARLTNEDREAWPETRGTVLLDTDSVTVSEESWHTKPRAKTPSRDISARGKVAPGTSFGSQSTAFLFYLASDYPPFVPHEINPVDAFYVAHKRVDNIELDGDIIRFRERLGGEDSAYSMLPVALGPSGPLNTPQQKAAVATWARKLFDAVVDESPSWLDDDPATFDPDGVKYPVLSTAVRTWMESGSPDECPIESDPALDIVLRIPPRSQSFPSKDGTTSEDAALAALTGMDNSFLAVQGPPGTGKTHTAAGVIASLVRDRRWRVGVVAQSHKTVENVLEAVLSEGLSPDIVGKKRQRGDSRDPLPWTDLKESAFAAFPEGVGCVVGGTAWDFAHAERFPEGSLDLLVIDEAGQFSLANTIAVARSAARLLPLGDPQQLPEVSTGSHSEPINTSALGWLSGDEAVLPDHLGLFLPDSWRMGPELCAVVSDLSYEGKLHSVSGEGAPVRSLEGVSPGLISVPIAHQERSVFSPEEAAEIVRLVSYLLGKKYIDSTLEGYRQGAPLGPEQIIVVAAYNAQVQEIEAHLARAGIAGISVGTVDRFQGRQAAVALISLAASSAREVPRGVEFLLMRNRLNVAISRAKWASFIVHSPTLGNHLPSSEAGLESLSGFLGLIEKADAAEDS